MELPVDVKNILEGVYYFLEEVLQNEELRGSVESMRLGLLLQLKDFKKTYPQLNFSSTLSKTPSSQNIYDSSESTASIPYPSMDFAKKVHNWRTSMSSSSGSSGYNTEWYRTVDESEETSVADSDVKTSGEKIYEEFEVRHVEPETKNVLAKPENSFDDTTHRASECIAFLPFRSLISKSNHHDVLLKECAGCVPSLQTFHGVLCGRLLHLYSNITDRSPFQVINLSLYTSVSDCHSEGNRQHNRKGKFNFELNGPENKGHIFCTYTLQGKTQWMKMIRKSIFFHGLFPSHNLTPKEDAKELEENARAEDEMLYSIPPGTSRQHPNAPQTASETKEVKRSHSINCPPEILRKRYTVYQARPLPEIPTEVSSSSSCEEEKTDDGESDNTYSDIEDDHGGSCLDISVGKHREKLHEIVRETKSFDCNLPLNTNQNPPENPQYGVIIPRKKTDKILNLINNKAKFFHTVRKAEDKCELKISPPIQPSNNHRKFFQKAKETESPYTKPRRHLFHSKKLPPLNNQSSERTPENSDSEDKLLNFISESKSLSQEIYEMIGERFASFPEKSKKNSIEEVASPESNETSDHLYDVPRQLHFNFMEQPYHRRFSETDLELYDTPRLHSHYALQGDEPSSPSTPSHSPPPLPPRPPPLLGDSTDCTESITIIGDFPGNSIEDLTQIAFSFT